MIVQCDKCRTKFRIADAKVTEAGVKVRCSRCAHVFMVKREDPTIAGPSDLPSIAAALAEELRESGLSVAPPPPPASGLPSFPAASVARPQGAPSPRHQLADMSAYAPVAPSSIGPPAAPYPVPSLVPDLGPPTGSRPGRIVPNVPNGPTAVTTEDAMLALGFAAPPALDAQTLTKETVKTPFHGPSPPSDDVFFDDDPTHAYPGGAPPSAVVRAYNHPTPPAPSGFASPRGSSPFGLPPTGAVPGPTGKPSLQPLPPNALHGQTPSPQQFTAPGGSFSPQVTGYSPPQPQNAAPFGVNSPLPGSSFAPASSPFGPNSPAGPAFGSAQGSGPFGS